MYSYFFQSKQLPDGSFDRAYGQEDHARFYREIYRTGVLGDKNPDSFKVIGNAGSATVLPGAAVVEGYMGIEPQDTVFPNSGDGKYAAILRLDVSDEERCLKLLLEKGESDYPPPVRSGSIYDLCLARGDVVGGVMTITDTRADPELCGFGFLWHQVPEAYLQVYDTPGTYTFTAPRTGWYIVEVVSGGALSDYGGNGGGYAEKLLKLNKGEQVQVTVGAAMTSLTAYAEASSFGSYVTASAPVYNRPGDGIGGDLNISGGTGNSTTTMPGGSFLCAPGNLPGGYGRGGSISNTGVVTRPATSGIVIIRGA